MSARVLCVVAALAAAAALAPVFSASAKEDPAKERADHEALRKELLEKKFFFYHDLTYFIDPVKLKDTRWEWKDPPPFSEVFELKGGQFRASWVPNAGAPPGIIFNAQKFPHYAFEADGKHGFSFQFKAWGQSVSTSKIDDMAKGFYEDWIRECSEFQKDKSTATRKKQIGPGEWWATAVGIDKEQKAKVRKIWYVWGTTGKAIPCTWLAEATIAEKFIDEDSVSERCDTMMKFTVAIEDKRAMIPPGVK